MNKAKYIEKIMVVPTDLINEIGYFEGINTDCRKYLNAIQSRYLFKERDKVENNTNFKQIVVYAIINYRDSILSYRRNKWSYETRLMNKLSIGIGGHITIDDLNEKHDFFLSCLNREINEEIQIGTRLDQTFVAVLNDDSNPVGTVHFGIIYIVRLIKPYIHSNEKNITECKFINIHDLIADLKSYEQWSKICIMRIDDIFSGIVESRH